MLKLAKQTLYIDPFRSLFFLPQNVFLQLQYITLTVISSHGPKAQARLQNGNYLASLVCIVIVVFVIYLNLEEVFSNISLMSVGQL